MPSLFDLYTVSGLYALFTTTGVLSLTWILTSWLKARERHKYLKAKFAEQSYLFDKKEGIRTSQYVKDGPLVDTMNQDLTTIHEVFQHGLNLAKDVPCLGWRDTPESQYNWLTYDEIYTQVLQFGSGLVKLHPVKVDQDACVGMYAVNCVEWAVTQQACSSFSFVIVPLYDTLGEEARKHILFQTKMSICVCDSVTRVRNILSDLDSSETNLQDVIITNPEEQLEALRVEAAGRIRIHTYAEILALGEKNPSDLRIPKKEDLHLICYTSGTTGNPKGVLVTHKMILSVIASFDLVLQDIKIGVGDVYLSFLPLAHVFEQIVIHYSLGHGASIGFFSGNVRNLSSDLLALRPTLFCAVPRVLQRLYATVQEAVSNSTFKSLLLKVAYAAKMNYVRQGIVTNKSFWDRYVLREIQDRMGGRLRFIAVGSAPISKEVYQFCRAVLGVHAFEAYGLTETCGAMVMTMNNDVDVGHVGPPLACSQVKLVDVPDMNYLVSRHGVGEICVRGPSCTTGYYKDQQRTRDLIDTDGWLHTGDIGTWTENGCLKLLDRCKNMFKLAQGVYVSPEKVESVYSKSRFVEQVFLDGDSRQWFAVAIVVPKLLALREGLIEANGSLFNGVVQKAIGNGSSVVSKFRDLNDEDLCQCSEAKKLILDDLIKLGKAVNLNGFEQAKSIYLTPNEFTVTTGLLTPTLKKCRSAFRQHFKEKISDMYREKSMV